MCSEAGRLLSAEVAATTTATQLGQGQVTWIVVQNRKTNADGTANARVVLVGGQMGPSHELQPGESTPRLPVKDLRHVWVRTLAGSCTVSYLGGVE